jgi:hypothetical protein
LITSYQIFRKTNPKIIVFYVETVKFIDHKLKNLHTNHKIKANQISKQQIWLFQNHKKITLTLIAPDTP